MIGYKFVVNVDVVKKVILLMLGGYKVFFVEVNNFNKCMGDLCDINGEFGVWVWIMSGIGFVGGGFSDNYIYV